MRPLFTQAIPNTRAAWTMPFRSAPCRLSPPSGTEHCSAAEPWPSWELNREGIKEGLEQIKVVPAAEGYDGTTLGFGRWERGALKGRYLVMRQWRDGVSVEL